MKKVLWVLCLFLLSICLTGCFESGKEKQKRQEYYKQAKENAVNYIQKKYGFTPKITNAKCTFDNSDSFSTSCTDMILVKAKYNGKSFKVLINGSMISDSGYDNYQYEQISKDIISLISKDFGKPYKYQIYYGHDDYNNEGMIDIYYDGTNLSNIMENSYLKCVIEYVDHNYLDNNKNLLSTSEYSIFSKLFVVNYKSYNTYKKLKNHQFNINGSYLESEFSDNSDYLKDVLTLHYTQIDYYKF